MRKPTVLDWLGGTALWFGVTLSFGYFLSEAGGAPEEVGVFTFLALFAGGVAGVRIWWLRRPASEAEGLTTGEAHLVRQEELEMRVAELEALHTRVAELEDRLDFSERLLASTSQHAGEERGDA